MLSCDSGQWQTVLCVALFPGLACSLLVYKIREYRIASDECARPGNEASCVPWQICCLLRFASWVTWPVVTGSCTCITGSCIMMFPISYLVYSVNYIVSLLITTRTNRVGDYNTWCKLVWLTITTLLPRLRPQSWVVINHKSQTAMHYLHTC